LSHTDRDDARYFWKNHFRTEHHYLCYGVGAKPCWCDTPHDEVKWTNPYRWEAGIPSWWKKDQRRAERAKTRNVMQRGRAGHLDWDDEAWVGYRRPWYW
jgi:hypothetical protein